MSQRSIIKIHSPVIQREGGGFSVRKVIGGALSNCDPFLMLDHIGPVDYKPGEALGAPDHPHRGFETVSYVIDGGVKHQDSAGNKGTLTAGWVQWMTAGKGIVHSEMPPDDLAKNGGRSEGFQLWVNLPSKHKMIPPKYQEMSPDKMSTVTADEGRVTVKILAGKCLGCESPMYTFTPIMLLDIHLTPGASYVQSIPRTYNTFVYVWRGSGYMSADNTPIHMGQAALLSSDGDGLHMKTDTQDCHVLFVAGEPINEPIVKYGPFVMNTEVEIQENLPMLPCRNLGVQAGEKPLLSVESSQPGANLHVPQPKCASIDSN